MEFSASLFNSVHFSFIYFEAVIGHMHTCNCSVSLMNCPLMRRKCFFLSSINFILKSILSNVNITIPDFLCLPFTQSILFHSFTFSLSLWLSFYRRHIVWCCFIIHSDSPCLLIGIFSSLMFNIISDIVRFTILFTVFCFLFLFLFACSPHFWII